MSIGGVGAFLMLICDVISRDEGRIIKLSTYRVIVFDGCRWRRSFFLLQRVTNVRRQRLDAAQQFVALVEVVVNVVQVAFDAIQRLCRVQTR